MSDDDRVHLWPADTVTIPRAQYDALMAVPYWLLKLRSLGYIGAGHGRKIADETLHMIRAAGIEIKADSERDDRNAALRTARVDLTSPASDPGAQTHE